MVFSAGPSVSPSVLDMARPVLELNQLKLRYPGSDSWTLDGLDLSLEAGETLALVGSSGCGKSTVARAVMQLLPAGTICEGGLKLTGQDPRQLNRPALRRLRGQAAGLVFQDPMTRLNPLMPVGEHLLDTLEGASFFHECPMAQNAGVRPIGTRWHRCPTVPGLSA
jgi:peptide/nickel transport system ATP-binding protein